MLSDHSSTTGDMDTEPGSDESLYRAIEALKGDLFSWIDTALDRLQSYEPCGGPTAAISHVSQSAHLGARGVDGPAMPASSEAAGLVLSASTSAIEAEAGSDRLRPLDRMPGDAAGEALAAVVRTDPGSQASSLNPRQRLDALARNLDRRLKEAGGAAGTSNDATGDAGSGARARDDRRPTGRRAGWDSEAG